MTFTVVCGGLSIEEKSVCAQNDTVKAVWFSYIDMQKLLQDKSKEQFTAEFTKVCDTIIENNCNAIYAHVRAFSDAMYPSEYFPWSMYISSQGKALDYDPLALMIEIAHSKGIAFHAWFNPYRISISTYKTQKLLEGSYTASQQKYFDDWNKKGYITAKSYNGNDCLFFEPGNEGARRLIVDGVKEVVAKYDVDGVIFDDYFYVWDYSNPENAGAEMTARQQNVNKLVSAVYAAVKETDSNATFGISPEGNISNAKRQGCDLDTWLSETGYIDYIAPQLYWTDSYETSNGRVTMFTNRLNSWLSLVKNGVAVYPALGLYRAGTESTTDKGWMESSMNLKKQWEKAKALGCGGYSLFSYSDMLSAPGKAELAYLNNKCQAGVVYQPHIQSIGWAEPVGDGATAGTVGRGLRLETIRINVNSDLAGSVEYRTHVQSIGWTDWVSDGADSGTTGRSLRLEALEIRLTGELAEHYDIYYRVHAQKYGWLDWAKNGTTAGTTGKGLRLEAFEIVLVDKGQNPPGATATPCVETLIKYRTHVQKDGWQSYVSDGELSGTSGRSLRLEALNVALVNPKYDGGIRYSVHCQSIGWMDWVENGELSGTQGRSLRLEAAKLELTGEMAEHYDVYYRVHCQNIGWMDWVKNGEVAGTSGKSLRLEAIEIKLVPKQ